ncbi:MAG: amidase [Jatrophihabitantaceae bacterium]
MTAELCYAPIRELAELVRTRAVSSVELVTAHLDRIAEVNPIVNAIVTLDAERALTEAAAADAALARGEPVGPLHGLPAAFKDTHATAGMRTTFGSPLLADNVPDSDELIVERMRYAGVITMGKTNVPEFAAGSHTFNPVFGLTRNPYDLSRSAGGSSGGAAVALATGMVAVAEGSDMGGSLRNPASFCNVVGLRPSPGRVPSYPDKLAWQTMSVQGPMGRTVDDVALLLSVISGPDPRCPISLQEAGSTFAAALGSDLTGLRVAWSPDLGGSVDVDSEVVDVLAAQVAAFSDLGCVLEQACLNFDGADEAFRTLRAWSFAHTLGDLVRAHRDRVKPSLVRNVEAGFRLSGQDVARAEGLHTELFHRAREFFDDYDALLLPTSQVAPFDAGLEYPQTVAGKAQESYLDWMRSSYFVTVTGCPALSVPAGFTPAGLPVGLQIVGPHRADRSVLQVGLAFERATGFGARRPVL